MSRSLLSAALLVSIAMPLTAQDTERRAMTTDDGLNMVRVSGALMSPDGEWVFYAKSELDWKENKRKSTYHMIPASGGEAFQYIGDSGGSSFQFSPDGRRVQQITRLEGYDSVRGFDLVAPRADAELRGIQHAEKEEKMVSQSFPDYRWIGGARIDRYTLCS